jgi:hypothetical protein
MDRAIKAQRLMNDEDQKQCPTCGGESRQERRMVEDNGEKAECRDAWHEPKIHEGQASITLET